MVDRWRSGRSCVASGGLRRQDEAIFGGSVSLKLGSNGSIANSSSFRVSGCS